MEKARRKLGGTLSAWEHDTSSGRADAGRHGKACPVFYISDHVTGQAINVDGGSVEH